MGAPGWAPLDAPTSGRRERIFVRLAPLGALGVLVALLVTGHLVAALALIAVVFALFQASLLSPGFAHRLEAGLARSAHAIAHVVGLVLSWTLLTVVFVLVIVPVSLVGLVFRRPLGRPRGLSGHGWIPREALSRTDAAPRMFGREPQRARLVEDPAPEVETEVEPEVEPEVPDMAEDAGGPTAAAADAGPILGDDVASASPDTANPQRPPRRWRRRRPRLVTALAVVAALVIVDLAAGSVLTLAGLPPDDRGEVERYVEGAVRTTMAAPPIASEPWAAEYGEALIDYQLGDARYVPYLVNGPHAFESRYLNATDTERVSYEPPVPTGQRPLRVAFLGGSVMFGVGQRDEHTIPSEFARLAEDAGVPVEVHNYGLPGWVSWQEFQYLERLVAAGEEYDLVVFYDGFNEFLVQNTGYSTDPTHLGAATVNQLAAQYHDEHEASQTVTAGLREVGSAYARFSAVGRLVDRLRGGDPVGEGAYTSSATPEQQRDAALGIYRRAIDLTGAVLDDRDTPVRFFWQPTKAGWDPSVTDRLPDEVTDVSHALDGHEDELYIDEVHTNEAGAHLMAQALWDELRPQVEALADPS